MVNRLQVTGSRVYSEAELLSLTGFRPGSELSLGDLRALALKITDHYRSAGFFVAQAYLPAQRVIRLGGDISWGVVAHGCCSSCAACLAT